MTSRTLEITAIKLSASEERFCQLLIDGMTQADAYAAAFHHKDWERKSLGVSGNRMAQREDIQARLEELRDQAARLAGITHAWVLERMAIEATHASEAASRVRALEAIARWLKIDQGREPASIEQMNDDQLDAEIAMWTGRLQAEGVDLDSLAVAGNA